MKLWLALNAFWLPVLVFGQTTSYKATWDIHPDTAVAGYRVLIGSASGVYTVTNTVLGRLNNTMPLLTPPSGVTYLVATAFTADGLESGWSFPEVKWTNQPVPPKNFRIITTIQAGLTPTGPWTNLASSAFSIPPFVVNP